MYFPERESSILELKACVPKKEQIINTVIAFCNMHGGKLIIGVADDGKVVGVPEKEVHELMEWLSHAIYAASAPPILPQIYQRFLGEKYLIVIDVSSGMQKPYYRKSLGLAKGTYIRLGPSTVKADADIIEELKLQARGQSYDQTPIHHASKNDIHLEKVKSFLVERRNGAKVIISNELLRAYGIIVTQHAHDYPSVCGMLLFGKDPQKYLTESYVLCSHFSGIKGREAMASKTCGGTLFEQFDAAYDFVVERLNKSYSVKGKRREEVLEIPAIAIREVLMNALLHRNYYLKAPIKIAIYANRIEIFSPGAFPGPMDPNDLQTGITYTRNIAIAKILWECRYIEKMGSGFITLFESYEAAGLATPDVIEGTNFIKCILYRERKVTEMNDDHARVLKLLQQFDEITRSDIVTRLNIPKTTAGRILSALVSTGEVVRFGGGRSTRYRKG